MRMVVLETPVKPQETKPPSVSTLALVPTVPLAPLRMERIPASAPGDGKTQAVHVGAWTYAVHLSLAKMDCAPQ